MSNFNDKQYVKLLTKYYDYNILALDIFVFVVNILLFTINPIISGICLILQLITFIISKEACDFGIGHKYDESNKFFKVTFWINTLIYVFTIVNIIVGALWF